MIKKTIALMSLLALSLAAFAISGIKLLEAEYDEYEPIESIPEEALLGKKENAQVFYEEDDYESLEQLIREKKLKPVICSTPMTQTKNGIGTLKKPYYKENKSGTRELASFAKKHQQKYVYSRIEPRGSLCSVFLLRPYTEAEIAKWKLGIGVRNITEDENYYEDLPKGAYVMASFDGYPAINAGIQAADIITQINSNKIESEADLLDFEASAQKGDHIRITLVREGQEMTVDMEL